MKSFSNVKPASQFPLMNSHLVFYCYVSTFFKIQQSWDFSRFFPLAFIPPFAKNTTETNIIPFFVCKIFFQPNLPKPQWLFGYMKWKTIVRIRTLLIQFIIHSFMRAQRCSAIHCTVAAEDYNIIWCENRIPSIVRNLYVCTESRRRERERDQKKRGS